VNRKVKPVFGDLYVLESGTLGYLRGEIAYIQNVIRGETKVETSRVLHRSENVFESEETAVEESRHEIRTSQRSRLESEVQEQASESTNLSIGAEVSGSMGFVDFSTNFGFEQSTSEAISKRNASEHAKEKVEHAVEAIRKETRLRREQRLLREKETTYSHTLENSVDNDHMTAIYRWIDKVEEFNLVRYGSRMMLEILVPEPAHYYRKEIVAEFKKSAAHTISSSRFDVDLEDIDVDNYLDLCVQYGVEITPPPPVSFVRSIAFEVTDDGKATTTVNQGVVRGEDGYIAASANIHVNWVRGINFDGNVSYNDVAARVTVGNVSKAIFPGKLNGESRELSIPLYDLTTSEANSGRYEAAPTVHSPRTPLAVAFPDPNDVDGDGVFSSYVAGDSDVELPVSVVSRQLSSFVATIRVTFVRTAAAFGAWRASVYAALAESHRRRAEEAAAMGEQNIETMSFKPSSRVQRRDTERIELKRACIWMLLEDGLSGNDPNFTGAPFSASDYTIPIADMYGFKARKIRMTETMLDWDNMAYTYYPSYWADHERWKATATARLETPDWEFLSAGYAHVVVPVQFGAEHYVQTYLDTGLLPDIDSSLSSDMAEAILQQLKDAEEATVVATWRERIPTDLLVVADDVELPTDVSLDAEDFKS
jgi:uncharacterized Zn finger protein (UPF0148 family)